MIVPCRLREIRGDRKMADLARAAGVHEGELSKIERGLALPRDKWIAGMETAYGVPRTDWWSPAVLLVLEHDPEPPR